MKTDTVAKLACAFAGLVWGLFWIPIRSLAAAGIGGVWSTFVFYAVPFALVLPLLLSRRKQALKGGFWLQTLGFLSAISLVLYSIAMLYTEIVRAMLLFYLTPLWSTLLARAFLGEPITRLRWVAMALGLSGMLTIFRADIGPPLPQSAGDWLALASGLIWSVGSVLLRTDKGTPAIELFIQNFVWSGVIALALALVIDPGFATSPPLPVYLAQLPWLVPVTVIVVMSGVYASMWGAPKLNPGIVGLLFMTEISVGAVTAAIWSGDPFGWREMIGVILITGAGVVESLWEILISRKAEANPAR